jgi:hypothetical protein
MFIWNLKKEQELMQAGKMRKRSNSCFFIPNYPKKCYLCKKLFSMKTKVAFLLLVICTIAQAQESDFMQEFERQYRLDANMKAMSNAKAGHEYLTIFTGDLSFTFSHLSLTEFLDKYMNMTEKTQDVSEKEDRVTSRCVEKTASGKQKTLTIKYNIYTKNRFYFPTRVEITGTAESVIKLFVLYWYTKVAFKREQSPACRGFAERSDFNEVKVNANDLKPGTYVSYQLPDKITLTIDSTGKAKIVIVANE